MHYTPLNIHNDSQASTQAIRISSLSNPRASSVVIAVLRAASESLCGWTSTIMLDYTRIGLLYRPSLDDCPSPGMVGRRKGLEPIVDVYLKNISTAFCRRTTVAPERIADGRAVTP